MERSFQLLGKKNIDNFKNISVNKIPNVANIYKNFPLISTWSSLINSFGLNLPIILITSFYGPQVAGWLMLSKSVIGSPFSVIRQSISQVYYAEAAITLREQPGSLQNFFIKLTIRLFLIGAIPLIVVAISGPYLFVTIFGKLWLEAGTYLRYLSAMFLFQFIVVPLSQTLNLLKRQDLQFLWDAGRLGVVIGSIFLADYFNVSASICILIYSISMTIFYIFLFLLILYEIKKQTMD